MLPVALALVVEAASPEERWDHRGAVGLLMSLSGLRKESPADDGIENTWRGALSVGASVNVGYRSNELIALGSVSLTRTAVFDSASGTTTHGLGIDGQLAGLFRGYFGEQWKTFVDLGLAVNFQPGVAAGPRVGIGLQYELSPLMGLFSSLGAFIGYGTTLVFRAELMIGVQLRSFWLE